MLNNTIDDCVKFFTTNFLNIMQANIPNKIMTFDDRDAPWITPPLKNLLRKDRKIYAEWTKNGRNPSDLNRIKQQQIKTQKAIQEAKDLYFADLSDKLCNPTTGQKTFWSAYKRLSNKKKITNTPPPCLTMGPMFLILRTRLTFLITILLCNASLLIYPLHYPPSPF